MTWRPNSIKHGNGHNLTCFLNEIDLLIYVKYIERPMVSSKFKK